MAKRTSLRLCRARIVPLGHRLPHGRRLLAAWRRLGYRFVDGVPAEPSLLLLTLGVLTLSSFSLLVTLHAPPPLLSTLVGDPRDNSA